MDKTEDVVRRIYRRLKKKNIIIIVDYETGWTQCLVSVLVYGIKYIEKFIIIL